MQALACAGVAGEEDVLALHHQLLHPFLRRQIATHGRTLPARPASTALPRVRGMINVTELYLDIMPAGPSCFATRVRVSIAAVTSAHLLIRQLRAGGFPRSVLHSNRRQGAGPQLLLRALLELRLADVRPGRVDVAGGTAVKWEIPLRLIVLLVILGDRSAASDTLISPPQKGGSSRAKCVPGLLPRM